MFGDKMTQKDDFKIDLQCGHPYKQPGETCELCGKVVPGAEGKGDEVRQSIQEDKGT